MKPLAFTAPLTLDGSKAISLKSKPSPVLITSPITSSGLAPNIISKTHQQRSGSLVICLIILNFDKFFSEHKTLNYALSSKSLGIVSIFLFPP